MKTIINNLRLTILAIMAMMGISAFGQNIALGSTKIEAGPEERDETFTVRSADVDWTVKIIYPAGQPTGWVTVTANGTGRATDTYPVTVTLHLTKNSTTTDRSAIVRVSGEGVSKDIPLTQYGEDERLTVTPATLLYNNAAGSQSIKVTSNVAWNANVTYTDGNDWLTLSDASGNTDKEITVTAKANTGSSQRKATITISGGGITRTVEVTQYGSGYLTVSTTMLLYSDAACSQSFQISSNVDWQISIEGGEGWLTVSPMSGCGDAEVKVSCSKAIMSNYEPYQATIIITGGGLTEYVYVRRPPSIFLATDRTELFFNPTGGTQVFKIYSSNNGWNITTEGDNGWLTVIPDHGTGDGTVSVTASPNTTNQSRTAQIVISDREKILQQTINVTCMVGDGITATTADIPKEQPQIFNLQGQKMNRTMPHGIYIINGKKVLK